MRVLKIERISGYNNSYYVYFDNGNKLRCYTKNIADFGLYSGIELSDERYEELCDSVSMSNTRERAAKLITARLMSEKELELRLLEKGEPEDNVHKAVSWLKEIRALDDEAYALSIVKHYSKKGYGKAKIKDELYRRYIPQMLWEDALKQMPENSEAIDKYIKSKLRGKTEFDRKELKKVTDGLYRRGFSWEEIKNAMRRFGENLTQDDA